MKIGTGIGTRVGQIGDKFTVSAMGRRAKFRGAWWCGSIGVDTVRVALGYINGIEPYIDGRLMSGKDADGNKDPKGVPVVKIKSENFDDKGRSWICVKVKVDADGKMPDEKDIKAEDLQIIQSKTRSGEDETTGLFAIAMLRLPAGNKSGSWTMRQIAYFDQKHMTRKPEKGRRQHFFAPAS